MACPEAGLKARTTCAVLTPKLVNGSIVRCASGSEPSFANVLRSSWRTRVISIHPNSMDVLVLGKTDTDTTRSHPKKVRRSEKDFPYERANGRIGRGIRVASPRASIWRT